MKTGETIRLVADPYPPYQYLEGRSIKGADHELIQSAFREYGIITKTTLFPWDECMSRMERGEAQGIFQIQATPERELEFIFSDPLRTARTVLFGREDTGLNPDAFDAIEDCFRKHGLGTVRGYSYGSIIDSMKGPGIVTVSSQEELIMGLGEKAFGMALIDLGVGKYLSAKMDITNIHVIPGFEITRVLHVAFQKKLGSLVNIFNAGLKAVIRKGIRDRILGTHQLGDN